MNSLFPNSCYTGIHFPVVLFQLLKLSIRYRSEFNFPHFFFALPIFTFISSPLSACFMDLSNILRLASLCKRYSVSSCSSSIMIEIGLFLNIALTPFRKLKSSSLALIWNVMYITYLFTKIQIIHVKLIIDVTQNLFCHEFTHILCLFSKVFLRSLRYVHEFNRKKLQAPFAWSR